MQARVSLNSGPSVKANRKASGIGPDLATAHLQEIDMSKSLKPGTPAPKSGQYQNPKTGTEVTGVQGKPLPPTPRPGQGYVLVDPTKHKR